MTDGSEQTDDELIAALGRRELGALELLFDRHHRAALGLAWRMLGEPQAAEAVVQEVFLTVWRRAEGYRPGRGTVKTWLLAMIHHRAVDRLRRRTLRNVSIELTDAIEDHQATPVWQQAFQEIQAEQIGGALDTLPIEQREIIELAYFGGKTQTEIAELQGI